MFVFNSINGVLSNDWLTAFAILEVDHTFVYEQMTTFMYVWQMTTVCSVWQMTKMLSVAR